MDELHLGPNGGMLYCLEYLEANFDWLEEQLRAKSPEYVVFDLPGQVELSTDHDVSVKDIYVSLRLISFATELTTDRGATSEARLSS